MADLPPQSEDTYTYTPPTTTTTTTTPPLTGSANISIREYIYFLPHPLPAGTPVPYTPGLPATNPLNLPPHPFEPTSTLVLTSPGRQFVDLRYLKPQTAAASASLPNTGDSSRLEWGFAGTSTSTASRASPHPIYGPVGHSVWTHWVDSRHAVGSADIPVDEGDMYALSPERTVECGVAFHPDLGRVAGHEEGWVDVQVASVDVDTSTATTTATAGARVQGTKHGVLLRAHSAAHRTRGVVLRVGQFCQGFIMVEKYVASERWEFNTSRPTLNSSSHSASTGWKRTARTGDLFLPCAATFRPEALRVGGVVRCGAIEWVVEELWEGE